MVFTVNNVHHSDWIIFIIDLNMFNSGGRPSLLTHHSQGSYDWEGGGWKPRLNIHAFSCCLGLGKWCYLPRPRWPVAYLDTVINILRNCPPISSVSSATMAWFLTCFHECFRRKVLNMYFVSKTVLNLDFNSLCFSKFVFSHIQWIFCTFLHCDFIFDNAKIIISM